MDKIIVVTSNYEQKKYLLECLNILFPECEVEFRYRQAEGFEGLPLRLKEDQKM